MAKNSQFTMYDDAGFPSTVANVAPITIGTTQTVKAAPGRLVRIAVTTVLSAAAVTVYDNASAASGTILFVIPASAAVGTIYAIDFPAVNGITVAGAGTGAITIGYS